MVDPSIVSCPHCGQRAPIVLRGIEARCTVCGGARVPFTAKSLNLAGKPARIGGIAAKLLGALVLVTGLSAALGLGLLVNALWTGMAALAVSLPIAIITLFVGLGLVLGGRQLVRHGDSTERDARMQTVRALAAHRRGSLTAADVARALAIPEAQADALLTELAKDPDANVSLDVDDDGVIRYSFGQDRDALGARIDALAEQPGVPVETAAAEPEALAEVEQEAEEMRSRRGR